MTRLFLLRVHCDSLELSDTQVFEPYIRALLGTASHFCKVAVLKLRTRKQVQVEEEEEEVEWDLDDPISVAAAPPQVERFPFAPPPPPSAAQRFLFIETVSFY